MAAPTDQPTLAERARTWAHVGRVGTLATCLADRDGLPFASLAAYGLDADGNPILLLSRLAVHSRNLLADPRASLLVVEERAGEDPLALGRATLAGRVAPLAAAEAGAVRAAYLERQPAAAAWVDFADFAFHRLAVESLYVVAGFGEMGWVDGDAYWAASPDPLAEHAARIIAHMNEDHADALRLYCRAYAGVAADQATMTTVDRLGLLVRARAGDETRTLRIPFSRPVATPLEARTVLVEMVRAAQARG